MNEHPHIELLEQLARHAGDLSPEIMRALTTHIASCAYCRDMLADIEEFTQALHEVSDESVRHETARLVHLAMPPGSATGPHGHILRLQRREDPVQPLATRGYALAAKSESARAGYSPIATLYSDDGRTLLRILHEREHATYFFQLMSEFLERVPYALLVAPGRDPMMTDGDGAFRVKDSEIDIVQIASMSIYFALDRLRTGPLGHRDLRGHDGIVLASDDCTVHLTAAGEDLHAHIRWHGPAETTPRFSGLVTEVGSAVSTVTDGVARLPHTLFPTGEAAVDGTFLLY